MIFEVAVTKFSDRLRKLEFKLISLSNKSEWK